MTLRAVNLMKNYRGRTVVNGVSLEVAEGEIVGLLGPNGAGETTTFQMFLGMVKADRGQVWLGDRQVTSLPMHQRARLSIGYLAQECSLFRKMTVEENVRALLEFAAMRRDERKTRAEEVLEEFHIAHIRHQKAYQLSGGEARRGEVARALALDPRFLLLDEPFLGVDPITVADFQDIIVRLRERGIGILITDHNVHDTLRIVDRAYIMNEGDILVSGSAEEVANSPIARKYYLGDRFTYANPGGKM
ncbi:MAG: LPS export ABC transporter ATP-binding protein [Armatimonadetes bacterium CG2_30_59_28]|nr:LPS export ABC transporter ATP-binding protein [Armatimonadota bacterium]OIO89428.1 MAG: LPS export ABC transporter ATP-binding protein [Armatimonadetes bacterium CG2_30_59_28]PIU64039.1 MAG: LPS export ABC transporter ATP-binding protein [Armatimonadetes bacterium CG07_land_8_20_14_0_80_59_28]PIX43884.1 MAG: LPS export ABC transporter ATP-binding protein [Armatimonadetes bacterium CG_4_8_14_3_um_filter_58_9]PIY46926.1 MAG: LPS export ABC transporter ATP-binding protein [Armatimonadetes bact